MSIVVCPGELFLENDNIQRISYFFKIGISKISRNCNFSGTKAPQGASRHEGACKYPEGGFPKLTSTKLSRFPDNLKNILVDLNAYNESIEFLLLDLNAHTQSI